MRTSEIPENKLLPFEVIEEAVGGSPEALSKVLDHFHRYILKMSMRVYYDEFGQSYQAVDEEMKRQIECRLSAQFVHKLNI